YPLTAHLDLPHGLACSFTLAEVLRVNAAAAPEAMAPLLSALGVRSATEAVDRIYQYFGELGLGERLRAKVSSPDALETVPGTLIHPGRAGNNLAPIDDPAARKLLARAWAGVTAPR